MMRQRFPCPGLSIMLNVYIFIYVKFNGRIYWLQLCVYPNVVTDFTVHELS